MKGYGLAALAPLATVYPSPPSGGTGDPGVPGRKRNALATANLHIELREVPSQKICRSGLRSFPFFILLTSQQHADARMKYTLIKMLCKRQFFQRQVNTAIRKGSNWGDFLRRLRQMYPVYETDFSVRTEIEELPRLPEFPVAQLEELMGRMKPMSHGPTEPRLWLVEKILPKTWENCRGTSERKSQTHSYDDLVDLLIELAMQRGR